MPAVGVFEVPKCGTLEYSDVAYLLPLDAGESYSNWAASLPGRVIMSTYDASDGWAARIYDLR